MDNLELIRSKIVDYLNQAEIKTVTAVNEEVFKECPSTLKFYSFENDVIIRDGRIIFIAENGSGYADYYPEFQSFPFVSKDLGDIAKKLGYFWEWENTACLSLAKY